MLPYGLNSLSWGLRQLTCLRCYQDGQAARAKGVICPVCRVDLCWPCMEAHLMIEDHQRRERKVGGW